MGTYRLSWDRKKRFIASFKNGDNALKLLEPVRPRQSRRYITISQRPQNSGRGSKSFLVFSHIVFARHNARPRNEPKVV